MYVRLHLSTQILTVLCRRIPVYIINALYLWPLTLWTYLNYGRPPPYNPLEKVLSSHCAHSAPDASPVSHCGHHSSQARGGGENGTGHCASLQMNDPNASVDRKDSDAQSTKPEHGEHACHNHGAGTRPIFVTLTIAICHYGAGCVIGDVIGEWIIYGTSATINGRSLWPAYLVGK